MRRKRKGGRIALSMLGLGLFLWFLATTRFTTAELKYFLVLLAFGIMAGWFAIPLRTGWTTVSEAIYYPALMVLGPVQGSVLAFTCVLGGYLQGTPRQKGRLAFQAILSDASLAFFPVLAAGKIYQYFGAPRFLPHPFLSLLSLAAVAVVFNALNNGMAMLYVYLEQGINPLELWLLNQLDEQLLSFSAVTAFLGMLMAVLLLHFPAATLLLIPIIFAIRQAMRSHAELIMNARKAMEALAEALDQRDGSTYHHSLRVSRLSGMLARHLGLGAETVEKIEWAAKIHDLGKIAILDNVLKKAGPLTEDEFRHMKHHPRAGAKVAEKLGSCKEESFMVQCHHEKFDGTGYPLGLKGEEIPLGARIIAVADFFDALTSTRIYRKGIGVEEVARMLENNKGGHFDPFVTDAFLEILKQEGDALITPAA